MTRDDIVGVYRGLGEDTVRKDGTVLATSTRNSQIMYSPDGYMSVVSTVAGRKPVAGADARMDLNDLSPPQRAETAVDVVAYAGRFEVRDGSVHHHIEMALNPNLVGQTRTRRIHLDGDDLTLSTVPAADGTYGRIRWRRVR